jgi:hypothetical protein
MCKYKIIIDLKIKECHQTIKTKDSSSSTTMIPANTTKHITSLPPINLMIMLPILASWVLKGDWDGTSLKRHHLKNLEPNLKSLQTKKRKSKDLFIFRDRKIRKLTNVNKHLLEQLKLQNDELTKRLQRQKFRIPKKSIHHRP